MSNNERSRMKIISATAVLTTEEVPTDEAAPVESAGAVAEETTPAAETPTAETPAAEEGADKPAVPEEYTDFTLPEGVSADREVIDEFKPLAKELGLPQDQAQKVVDLGAKLVQRTLDGIIAQHQERVSAWIKEAEADKEIGEDVKRGKKSATLRAFNTLIEGDERVKQMVDETGVEIGRAHV